MSSPGSLMNERPPINISNRNNGSAATSSNVLNTPNSSNVVVTDRSNNTNNSNNTNTNNSNTSNNNSNNNSNNTNNSNNNTNNNGMDINDRIMQERAAAALQNRVLIQEQRELQERAIHEMALQGRAIQERALQARVLSQHHSTPLVLPGHIMPNERIVDPKNVILTSNNTIASPGPV